MHTIDLNCDMGEGLTNDAFLMPYISSANIACGYHAGNTDIMKRTVELALFHKVAIGVHPGFDDKENFGRTEMQLPAAQVYNLVTQQIHLLQKTAINLGTVLHHVKPHGALYNMSARDAALAHTIARAIYDVNPNLIVFGLSGSYAITEAARLGLKTASEVFADRTYQDNGSLTPRTESGALICSDEKCIEQVLQMIEQKTVTSVTGKTVPIEAETICIHGDGQHAVSFAAYIYQTLQQKQIGIKSV